MAESEREQTAQAKEIINQLSIALRTGQFHNIENNAVLVAMGKVIDAVNPFIEAEGFLRIDLVGDFLYVNDVRIRYPLEYLLNFDYLTEQLRARDIGSISFLAAMETAEFKMFLSAFMRTAGSEEPFDNMVQLLDGVENIAIERTKAVKKDDDLSKRKAVKKTYFNAVCFCRSIMTAVPAGEKMQMKKAKRVVESMVDAVLAEEQLLIGMTAIKDYDKYTYHHSVNVSILSIAMGQRMGMSRKNITALGIAALFHDI
ncbi:MAG: hypothetical protein JSU90_12375 [Nitrospiraceae bacterium]|nr:MAG: hypothetical protein JSU90_12375 [Nitrospiraceae bacterium]